MFTFKYTQSRAAILHIYSHRAIYLLARERVQSLQSAQDACNAPLPNTLGDGLRDDTSSRLATLLETFAERLTCNNFRIVPYQVYILRCIDGTFYTGQTTDLDKRIQAHNRGKGARYTRGRGPVELVYSVGVATLKEAFLLEHKIKRLPRSGKEKLIAGALTQV